MVVWAISAVARSVERVSALGDRTGTGSGLVLLGGIGYKSWRWGLATVDLVGETDVTINGEVRWASLASELWPSRGAAPHFAEVLSIKLCSYSLWTIVTQ